MDENDCKDELLPTEFMGNILGGVQIAVTTLSENCPSQISHVAICNWVTIAE